MSDVPTKIYSIEYDNYPSGKCRLEIRETEDNETFVVSIVEDKEYLILKAERDQWGVWVEIGSSIIGQEDGTRSFIDALIKTLNFIHRRRENPYFRRKFGSVLRPKPL